MGPSAKGSGGEGLRGDQCRSRRSTTKRVDSVAVDAGCEQHEEGMWEGRSGAKSI